MKGKGFVAMTRPTARAAAVGDQTGSVEITIWPETYEQSGNIWKVGNIIIASVRVKARDERLQVSVQKAMVYGEEGFDPALLLISNEPPLRQPSFAISDQRFRRTITLLSLPGGTSSFISTGSYSMPRSASSRAFPLTSASKWPSA